MDICHFFLFFSAAGIINTKTCPCLFQKEIRSSLVLSMLQQMLMEDKAELVREAVIKSLVIIMGYIDDPDNYQQVCFSE